MNPLESVLADGRSEIPLVFYRTRGVLTQAECRPTSGEGGVRFRPNGVGKFRERFLAAQRDLNPPQSSFGTGC